MKNTQSPERSQIDKGQNAIRSALISFLIILFPTFGTARFAVNALSAAERPAEDLSPRQFIFERLNRDYRDLAPKIAEIQKGPLVIHLSSPKQVILLRSHRLSLMPTGNGRHRGRLEFEFEGSGDLLANVTFLGINTRLSDRFWIPRQKKAIAGEVRVKRVEAGYHLKALTLPKALDVRIRTGLGSRLVDWCNSMAWLSASMIDCQDLDRALSVATIPLDTNAVYFIPNADLLPEERAELDDYLQEPAAP